MQTESDNYILGDTYILDGYKFIAGITYHKYLITKENVDELRMTRIVLIEKVK